MGDKRRYRATKGVLRRQRGIKGLCRWAKRRKECVFVVFRSTRLLCNWRPFRRPLPPLLRPEHSFSLTLLCCHWRPFRHPLMPLLRPERLSIALLLNRRVLTPLHLFWTPLYGFLTPLHHDLTSLWHIWRLSLPFNAFGSTFIFFPSPFNAIFCAI